ncbi:O-antigen ligase family protein [Micromonospora chersina]|uniref:O-antigen ligase family protein n=1 Tax=Micromonospora chersina TaxID=47854 RepID=UPI003684CA59
MPSITRPRPSDTLFGTGRPAIAVPGQRAAGAGARFSVTLLTLLFVLALAGRFSLDRAGLPTYGIHDLRIPAYALLLLMVLLWQVDRSVNGLARPWPRVFALFSMLIALQLASAFWAPDGARLQKAGWDLIALWFLVLVATVLAAADPRRAARTLLVLMLVAALVYALGALATGPQGQGRYSAFGGGPNVFVRVISLGIIASIGLSVVWRRWWLLLPIPLLVVAAVLSGSRGGLIGLVGAGTAYFVVFARRRLSILLGTLVAGGLAVWAVSYFVDTWLATMVETRYSSTGIQSSDFSARPELLRSAWRIFLDHPLLGGGLDSFYATVGIGYPHNYLAGLAAESGLPALVLIGFTAACWWRDGRPWTSVPKEQLTCAVGAIYVLIAAMFSGDHFDTRFCWILAVVAVLRPGPRSDHPGQIKEAAPWQSAVRRHAEFSS